MAKRFGINDRVMSKVVVDSNGCWLWQAHILKTGYGLFWFDGKMRLAHRVTYFLETGIWSTRERCLDHLCRVRHCVNPAHLELVTQKINQARGIYLNNFNAAKTHCPSGHEYSLDNTRRYGSQGRKCLECKRKRDATYRKKVAK